MNEIDIINKKRLGEVLSKEELEYMIMGYVNGNIPDYQMSAFLMSICTRDMTLEEICDMADIMINSGDTIDLSDFGSSIVDKHSTGGVGDKTTLVVGPIVAANNIVVAKMSGRGLGFTGGTIDKLESIPGFKTSLTKEEFVKEAKDISFALTSGSQSLVPADKKIYALRDVTGTVESIPLIATSIMSKKIAAGNKKIVIDLKVGKGALMKNESDAKRLASVMIEIGKRHNVEVVCVLSRMDEPLGYAVGNGLEIMEVTESLKGNMASDLKELITTLASHMISLGKGVSIEEAESLVDNVLENKKALDKWFEFVSYQGGDIDKTIVSSKKLELKSDRAGYIHNVDAYHIASLSLELGSGRKTLDDEINFGVGIWLNKKTGDLVKVGDTLATIYYGDKDINLNSLKECFTIGDEEKERDSIIIDVVK